MTSNPLWNAIFVVFNMSSVGYTGEIVEFVVLVVLGGKVCVALSIGKDGDVGVMLLKI